MENVHDTPRSANPSNENPNPQAPEGTEEAKRDENGRFKKGNRGGPGNPYNRQVARMRQMLLEAVNEEDIRAMMLVIKDKALQGDLGAAKLLLSYTAGKPQAGADPDTIDQHELKTMLDNHSAEPNTVKNIANGAPVEWLLTILREMLPGLLESKYRIAEQTFSAPPAAEERAQETPPASPTPAAERPRRARPLVVDIPEWMNEMVERDQAWWQENFPKAGAEHPSAVDADLLRDLENRTGQFSTEQTGETGPAPTGNGADHQPDEHVGAAPPIANGKSNGRKRPN